MSVQLGSHIAIQVPCDDCDRPPVVRVPIHSEQTPGVLEVTIDARLYAEAVVVHHKQHG